MRVLTLREYLEALGARLELVAVSDDDRRIPINLGMDAAQRGPSASTGDRLAVYL